MAPAFSRSRRVTFMLTPRTGANPARGFGVGPSLRLEEGWPSLIRSQLRETLPGHKRRGFCARSLCWRCAEVGCYVLRKTTVKRKVLDGDPPSGNNLY